MDSNNCKLDQEFHFVKLETPGEDEDLQWQPQLVDKEDCELRQPLASAALTTNCDGLDSQGQPVAGAVTTPRSVFADGDLARPRSRGEEVRDAFRISLGPEVFRRARADKLQRQVRVYSTLLILLVVFLFLGVFYFNPFKLHRIQESTDWEMNISQLSVVFGLMFLAVLVNLGFLLRAFKAHRRIKMKLDSLETGYY